MADEEMVKIAQVRLVSPVPKGAEQQAKDALNEVSEYIAQGISNVVEDRVEIATGDGESITVFPEPPEAQNGRNKSFSISVSAARYQQIFGHTGFKQ